MASKRLQRQIDRLLDEAEEAITRLDWEVVRARARAVLAIDFDNSEGRAFLDVAERAPGAEVDTSQAITSQQTPSVPSAAQPSYFANGRYQVTELLGEGGKKRVYQAHDSVLDRDVALAAIKTEGLDPTSRVRITREAQAMGRLGDHPHVLQIFDLGEDNGQPYMVLPLMPGGDVETLLETAEDHKLPLKQAIDLATQICRGLEFAHSKEIVHRDLKPGNVWLTADGIARIGDFGLAVAIDRSRLTQEGMMVGTVSYMPPEQAMGGEVTPRSDLYSLGAMLYEMVCGRPPFLGDDSVAIIGQHINTPPVAPTWHNSECPRALEALILRLLAKDPSERPESAADVLTALEGIDLTVSGEETAPERDEAHALDSLAGGVFVGRQREMGELKAALEDALSGRGRLVTLVGEPGIGKTRTAQELATYAGLRSAQVLWGRCHESRGAPPYWPWVQVIRSYVRERDPERLRSEMGTGAADIAEIVSDVRERLPDLKPAPAADDPEQARFRLFDSITAFLRSASRSQPLVVILDNLHWADKPSLLLLEFLAQEFSDSRLLVIGTYRDVDLSRQHPLVETLGELTRERLFQRVLLRGLSQDDVSRFIELTSSMTPRGLAEAVHTQTEGNPLFVTEVVRLLVQEGELSQERARERDSWEVRIPEGVREVIGRRLNRLSARCNETLTIASVIGREFELRHLVSLVEGMSEDRLLEVLEEALSARVIEELPQTVGHYEFTHALIRQTLYDELSTTRRVRSHARIAHTLEEMYGDAADANAVELAYHFGEAEAVLGTEKLVQYSALAGERALAVHGYEDAASHFERALVAREGRPMDSATADILFGLGRAQIPMYMVDAAVSSLTRAFDYYVEVEDVFKAVAIAAYSHSVHLVRGMSDLIPRALPLVAPGSRDAGYVLANYGFALGLSMDGYETSREELEEALNIARREGDRALEMRTLANMANIAGFHLRWSVCLEAALQALEFSADTADQRERLRPLLWATGALRARGDSDKASVYAEHMMSIAEEVRDRIWMTRALAMRIMLSFGRGDWQTVRELADRAFALGDEYRSRAARLGVEHQLGDLEWDEVQLVEIVREVYDRAGEGAWTEILAQAAVDAGASPETLEELEAVTRAAVSSNWLPIRVSTARRTLAVTAIARGDMDLAAEQYAALESESAIGLISTDRLLGRLARTMGDLDKSATHFEDGLAFCRKAGYRPELAWTCCDYADMLLERDAEGDREKSVALLDESLAISSDLGMRPLMERVLSRKMSLQGIDVSSPETSIDAVVSAVEAEHPNLQPHAAPDGTVTIMFTDIEGSTAMTERLGDQRAQDVLRTHNAIIREQVGANEGFEVKSQGDGFMMAFSSARRALECAIAIQQNFAIHEEAHPGEPIRIRIGLHTGEAIKEGEDFFGKTVILAARIASEAQGGQILVSSLLKALVESSGEFRFGEGRELELKGLAGVHEAYNVRWADRS